MCLCVSVRARGGQRVRVWRAPRASVAPGESSREKEPKPAAAELGGDGGGSEPGPRDEAPACPQLPGELISHHHRSSGITTPGRHAALGGPAPALPARPRGAPGKELRGWLLGSLSRLQAAERTLYSRSTSGATRGGRRAGLGGEATTGRCCPYLSPPSCSEAERGGRGRRRKRKRRGWGGRTGYKDRLGGGMVEDFWSPQQRLFLWRRRQQQKKEKQP